jgi:RNA polymerase sigma-70 factor (ECF subfamily)
MGPESWLVQAREGNHQAWDDLLAWVRPFIRALLGQKLNNPEDASDLTNDVQLRIHRGFGQFRGVALGQFRAWVRQITARVLCDHLANRRLPLAALTVDPPCPPETPSDQVVGTEDMVRLAEALHDLPPHYREVIEARLFEGLPCHVIAQRLGCPAGRVRVYSMRAVELLSARLRGKS